MIVVLEVEGVPAVGVDHEALPFCDDAFEVAERPGTWAEFVVVNAVDIDAECGERGQVCNE